MCGPTLSLFRKKLGGGGFPPDCMWLLLGVDIIHLSFPTSFDVTGFSLAQSTGAFQSVYGFLTELIHVLMLNQCMHGRMESLGSHILPSIPHILCSVFVTDICSNIFLLLVLSSSILLFLGVIFLLFIL